MKRKHLSVMYLLLLVIGTILSLYMPKTETATAEENLVIPKEAIRLRILANSDKKADQDLKHMVRDEVNKEITTWVKDLTSMDEARKVISSHKKHIQEIAEKIVKEQGSNQSVKVEFGQAKFPTKLYGQYLYPAGTYEAIVITLGKGEGANWWCVLFPPLCFLDFSNGTAVSQSPMDDEKSKTDENSSTEEEQSIKAEKKFHREEKVEKQTDDGEKVWKDKKVKKEKNLQDESDQASGNPLYTSKDEQPVKVKFFFIELFSDLFK